MEAKRDEIDALDERYGNDDMEEVINGLSRVFGNLNEGDALVGGAGGSNRESLAGGVMKDGQRSPP